MGKLFDIHYFLNILSQASLKKEEINTLTRILSQNVKMISLSKNGGIDRKELIGLACDITTFNMSILNRYTKAIFPI